MTDSATSPARAGEPRRLPPADALELSASGRALLVDVRDEALYQNAHLKGAVPIPFAAIQAADGRLPAGFSVPPNALLILYCA